MSQCHIVRFTQKHRRFACFRAENTPQVSELFTIYFFRLSKHEDTKFSCLLVVAFIGLQKLRVFVFSWNVQKPDRLTNIRTAAHAPCTRWP